MPMFNLYYYKCLISYYLCVSVCFMSFLDMNLLLTASISMSFYLVLSQA